MNESCLTRDYLDAKLADLKADLKTDLTWRFIGLMGLQTGILLGAMYFMLTHHKP
jgi:hypothetical protein